MSKAAHRAGEDQCSLGEQPAPSVADFDGRVGPACPLQVLVAMMFDDFMSTGMQSLDYDRVVRCAVTIQVDPDVCKVLNATPSNLDECWMPDDACAQ